MRKKCKPEWVGILCGPQTSQCNRSKGEWVVIELSVKDNLVCFANGQILQLWERVALLRCNWSARNLKQGGEEWPKRKCHKSDNWDTWFAENLIGDEEIC